MGLSPRESFRLGFLLRCAEEGLTPDEVRSRVKLAFDWKLVGKPLELLATLPLYMGAVGLAGSAGVGAAGGYLAARAQDEDIDPDVVKRQELIAAYKQQADRARRQAARFAYRAPQTRVRPARLT